MIVVLSNNRGIKNFQNVKEAFKYYNKCEVNLTVDGEKSVLVLGMKDNVIVRDFFYKSDEGYFSSVGFDYKTIFMNSIDGFAYEVFYVKKTDEYYIRVYSSVGELPQISDSCDSVFYSIQPFPSNITKSKIYYAFVKDFNDDYQLKINDKLTFKVVTKTY